MTTSDGGAGVRAHGSRYKLLGIAPLLRKLLVDGSPLLNTVRAARQEVPTAFRIRQWSDLKEPQHGEDLPYLIRLGGPELVGGPQDPALSKLKQFIGARVGMVQGRPLTVREVVNTMSRLMTLAVAMGLETQVNELDRYRAEAMPGLHRLAAGQKVEMGDSEEVLPTLCQSRSAG